MASEKPELCIELPLEEAMALALYYRSKYYGKRWNSLLSKKLGKIAQKYNLTDKELDDLAKRCWDSLTSDRFRVV